MLSTNEIIALRGPKNAIDPFRPYAWLHETELNGSGELESFATLFLSNAECPFRCLMCDLWRNTTDEPVPPGAIAQQIQFGLAQLPAADSLKLYNSGNFFDVRAIAPAEHAAIARLARGFRRLVVENHPRLVGARCVEFQQCLEPQLEIALGLETIHPKILPALNKQMTVADFSRAVAFLRAAEIDVRVFVLLQPPGLEDNESIEWAVRSVAFAFECGANCCSLIPVRQGNGALDELARRGLHREPTLAAMEQALQQSLALKAGRVTMDLWDAHRFATCDDCAETRVQRLQRINLTQEVSARIDCNTCGHL